MRQPAGRPAVRCAACADYHVFGRRDGTALPCVKRPRNSPSLLVSALEGTIALFPSYYTCTLPPPITCALPSCKVRVCWFCLTALRSRCHTQKMVPRSCRLVRGTGGRADGMLLSAEPLPHDSSIHMYNELDMNSCIIEPVRVASSYRVV